MGTGIGEAKAKARARAEAEAKVRAVCAALITALARVIGLGRCAVLQRVRLSAPELLPRATPKRCIERRQRSIFALDRFSATDRCARATQLELRASAPRLAR